MKKAMGVLWVFLLVWVTACQQEPGVLPDQPGADSPVRVSGIVVAAVESTTVPQVREFAATVQARTVSRISSRLMAQVIDVAVLEGTRVSQGDILIRLDDRELRTRVRQAESGLGRARAELELAGRTHERYRKLLEEKAVSPQEYDTVAAREKMARQGVRQAEGAVTEAETFLGFSTLRSSVSGRVVSRRIDPGSMAAPGMELMTIEPEGSYRLEVPVDMSVAGNLRPGDPVSVEVESAGLKAEIPIREIVPRGDPSSRTVLVKLDLPGNEMLRTGQYGRVRTVVGSEEALMIPAEALVHRGQLDGVFAVQERTGNLRFRIVRIGRRDAEDRVQVLSGLKAGDRIVVQGASLASDGVRVTPAAGSAQLDSEEVRR